MYGSLLEESVYGSKNSSFLAHFVFNVLFRLVQSAQYTHGIQALLVGAIYTVAIAIDWVICWRPR